MALVEIAVIMFISFAFIIFAFLSLRSKNMRTMFKLSLPFFSAGKVFNINFKQNQTVDFDLVDLKDNQLMKYSLDDPEVYKNKEIESGSAYIESASGKPIYVTVTGAEKTVDPAKGADPSLLNDSLIRKAVRLGEKREEYKRNKANEPPTIAGITPAALALVMVVIVIGLIVVEIMNWQQMAEIGAAIVALQGG